MGCANSKPDELPAVLLCRERCAFLDEAIHQRYALAEAHVAYFQSLKAVGLSLHRFFDQDLLSSTAGPPSPVLNLPTKRKGDPEPSTIRHSHSHSGSHLNFNSDSSDDEDPELDYLHHHLDDTSPEHQHQLPYGQLSYVDNETLGSYPGGFMNTNYMKNEGGFMNMNYMKNEPTPSVVVYQQRPASSETVRVGEFSSPDGQLSYADNRTLGSYPGGFMNMNYMQNKATPSVVYEQRPMSSGTVRMGESSSYSPYPYSNQNPSSYSYNGDSNYGGYYGSSQSTYGPVAASSVASSSKLPPPPPSPPSSSAWDFLNPFESFEKFYPPYTPSRDSKEVREEEGIPDLEDEYYYQQEVVKEVHGDEKFVNYSKAVVDDEDGKANNSEWVNRSRPSVSLEDDNAVEFEVHMVDKKVVDKKDRSGDGDNVAAFNVRREFRDDYEVVKEIKVQFERASELGSELAKMLEVGKLPHNRKHAAYQVPSKMLNVITPSPSLESSKPSTSTSAKLSSIENTDPGHLNIDEDVGMRSGNLSSTLKKLYLWEKKLYEEVKVEEKMRVLHERKCQKLKRLDERGAEAHKVDVTRTLVRSLSTKIRIAIQVVDKISVKINKLRDEELWPQLNEFIQGLTRMWKSMLECHHSQCQAIGEARRLDSIASRKNLSDAHLDATLELEHELLNWTLRFSCWVGAQKGYVRALNNWLLKCLLYVPEETADGVVPFSPGRIGAPPVFVICNQWSQALESISEKEVVDSMRELATSVLQLWEQDKQRMIVNKDMERKVKNLEMKDQKIQKEIQALEKRMVSGDGNSLLLSGQAVYQSDTSKNSSLQVSLQHIFEAMDRFTTSSLKVYEELLQRIEEERLAQEREKVS